MRILKAGNPGRLTHYFISSGLVLSTSLLCFFSTPFFGYRPVALILFMTVSILAILFDLLPVVIAAILSAIIWYFFFIPPILTFHFAYSEDLLIFLVYLAVALTNAMVVFKIRHERNNRISKEEEENTKRLYNTIFNSTSHELRAPISVIIGATDVLQKNKDCLSTETQKILITQIAEASILLNRHVENLLNMSRLESGLLKPKPDWCDTNELIYTVIQKLSETSPHNIQFLSNSDLPLFKYDRALMEQVLLNLLQNAITISPEDGIITIEVLHQSDKCIIKVADSGTGIPESETNFVFDKFHGISHSKTKAPGLGLAIVKGFTEALHGKIKLENNMTGGSTFTIEIPAEVYYLNTLKNV